MASLVFVPRQRGEEGPPRGFARGEDEGPLVILIAAVRSPLTSPSRANARSIPSSPRSTRGEDTVTMLFRGVCNATSVLRTNVRYAKFCAR